MAGISAGSALLYSPILYDVLRKKSAMGLSPVTWVLQTVGSAGMVVYPLKSKYPLSTYFEFITLSVQSAAIFVALAAYGDVLTACRRCSCWPPSPAWSRTSSSPRR